MDVHELSDMILGNFRSRLAADNAAQHIIKNGSKMTDLPRLSQIFGRYLTAAVESSIKDYPFPFGTDEMQQIAEDILDPIMRESCKLLDDVFIKIQRQTDKKNGINFEPVLSKYQATRAKQIYLSAADPLAKKETILRRLSVPPATLVNNHVDRTMQSNAKARNEAGFEIYIIRTDNGKCCPWCAKITGRYSYPDKTPKDIFRRHDNCGCTVVYESGNMRQNVHTKRTWEQASVTEPKLERDPDVTVPELVRNPKVEVPELKRGLLTEGENGGIIEEIRELGIKGEISIPPRQIDINKLSIDSRHIAKREHYVSFDEAVSFITDASVSISRWNGMFENYFSYNGAAFVNLSTNMISTAFFSREYEETVSQLMEVLRKYGK